MMSRPNPRPHPAPIKFRLALISCLLASVMMSGCSWFSGKDDGRGRTLADLPEAKLPDTSAKVELVNVEQIEQSYRAALANAEDPKMRQQIQLHLADLEMMRSENTQLNAQDVHSFYDKPIAMYRELLKAQEADPKIKSVESDQLRYKLAKALSLDGRSEEAGQVLDSLAESAPESPFIAETQFRRAEKAFSEGNYKAAEAAYASVVSSGDNAQLKQNALYMEGWAQFKRSDYEQALKSFAGVLDQLLGSSGEPADMEQALTDLGAAKTNLINDTLRVMGLSLSYLEGPQSISDLQTQLGGKRPYEYMLYQQLGQLYLEQKRFTDSANTYQHFVEHNPDSDFAPSFSIKVIDTYQQGDFPSLILPAKQDFVERYGIRSNFWTSRKGVIGSGAIAYLHQSLEELAQFEHAQAQSLSAANKKAEAEAAYGRAANWYREFVQTFEKDPQAAEMTFLLAECLNESGDLPGALEAYEQVAYGYSDKLRGADAGYSAVIIPQRLISSADKFPDAKLVEWKERKIENALRFAEVYKTDPRAMPVLTDAGSELLSQSRYLEAKAVAERVIAAQPPADGALQFTSWLILGHSRFELKEYADAELAYTQVLSMLPVYGKQANAPTPDQVRERIAASIYRQAEASLALGDKDTAINQLLRITQVTPNTDIAIKAQYDAGLYLMEEEKWQQAENVYSDFRRKYPKHELTATLPAKMVVIYQGEQKWQQAADELNLMASSSSDPEVKRQSVYMAAELYEKSGKRDMAIEQYRRYASDYPRPLANALEAQFKLTELYKAAGDSAKRNYWLQQIVATNKAAGSAKTDRSVYLAASAQTELSEASYDKYLRIKLTLPIKTSLKAKRAAMEQALKEQEQILNYGVAEFTTQASYKIGEIYAQLGKDLLDSQRPKGLDELALEQYELLLEEQADPFQEKAIEIHQANAQRAWKGTYGPWVKRSFEALAKLVPARYNKQETRVEVSHEIQ